MEIVVRASRVAFLKLASIFLRIIGENGPIEIGAAVAWDDRA
jgi:hypothetical protein